MSLLLDEDYEYLQTTGLEYAEEEASRFLIIKNFEVDPSFYAAEGKPITHLEVLVQIPANYNMDGGDMFWTHPAVTRADGSVIPQVMGYGGGDERKFEGKEYCRWSRHFVPGSWKPKIDNIEKILARLEKALKNP